MINNKKVLYASIIMGVLSFVLDAYLFKVYENVLPMPFLIGALFMILFGSTFIVVLLFSKITGAYDIQKIGIGKYVLLSILAVFASFVLCTTFEWIYELDIVFPDKKIDAYVFVIDDSGSMRENDATQLRKLAVENTTKDIHVPYAIYTFSSDIECQKQMSETAKDIKLKSWGETKIHGVLKQMLEDKKAGKWLNSSNIKVVLLTDGKATDLGFLSSFALNKTLKECCKQNISISTVGLGNACDDALMSKIANKTNGSYININDAKELISAIKEASHSFSKRNLISVRPYMKYSWLYGLMRIIFLFLIGTVLGSLFALAYANEESNLYIHYWSVILAALSSIFTEVFLQIGIYPKAVWLFLWICIAATLGLLRLKNPAIYVCKENEYLHIGKKRKEIVHIFS